MITLSETVLLSSRNDTFNINTFNGPFTVYLPLPQKGGNIKFIRDSSSNDLPVYPIFRGIFKDNYDVMVFKGKFVEIVSTDKFWEVVTSS